MNEKNTINFFNPDGSPKSKEDFLKEIEGLYDIYTAPAEPITGTDLINFCINSEYQIETENVYNTFNFYERVVEINDEITQETAKEVINTIRFWNKVDGDDEKNSPIYILINTPGGDLHATLSIIAAIQTSNTPVYTVNMGMAWSGGFFILIAGHRSFALPYASYLFHEGSNIMGGDAHKIIQQADFYQALLKQLRGITLDNTSISEELYEKHKKDDWWFTNEDAIKYCVIDGVIEDINEIGEEEDA